MRSIEFRMPDVGEGIAEAEIIQWFADEGEKVHEDEPLCAVETDKSLVEIPAPATGTITERLAEVGDIVAVGSILVVIGVGSAPAAVIQDAHSESDRAETQSATVDQSASFHAAQTSDAPHKVAGTASVPADHVGTTIASLPGHGLRPKASPRVRRVAAQSGVDLRTLAGTGPHGRILETDLDRARTDTSKQKAAPAGHSEAAQASSGSERLAQTSAPAAPADLIRGRARASEPYRDEVIPLRGLRRSIARSMTAALSIPHVTEFREVDASNLLTAHRTLRASLGEHGVRLSLFPLLLQAVIRTLQLQPSMNATFDAEAETVTRHGGVHLGMATATDDGLIVPVIHNADQLGLVGLSLEADRLAEAARGRTARPDDLTGGTFTVTNFGSFGTWLGNPIIRPPEVGIAGFGRISEKVIAVDGEPRVRPVLPIVVATDHRVHDGSHLADFVTSVAAVVTDPVLLLA